MHATPQVITSEMQLYFTGESFRNVQKFLRLQGVNVSHMGVYKWINKYVGLIEKYLEQIKPNVSDVWRTDELYLKVKGNNKVSRLGSGLLSKYQTRRIQAIYNCCSRRVKKLQVKSRVF